MKRKTSLSAAVAIDSAAAPQDEQLALEGLVSLAAVAKAERQGFGYSMHGRSSSLPDMSALSLGAASAGPATSSGHWLSSSSSSVPLRLHRQQHQQQPPPPPGATEQHTAYSLACLHREIELGDKRFNPISAITNSSMDLYMSESTSCGTISSSATAGSVPSGGSLTAQWNHTSPQEEDKQRHQDNGGAECSKITFQRRESERRRSSFSSAEAREVLKSVLSHQTQTTVASSPSPGRPFDSPINVVPPASPEGQEQEPQLECSSAQQQAGEPYEEMEPHLKRSKTEPELQPAYAIPNATHNPQMTTITAPTPRGEVSINIEKQVLDALQASGVSPEAIVNLIVQNDKGSRDQVIKDTGFSTNYIMKLQRKVLHSSSQLQLPPPVVHSFRPGMDLHVMFDSTGQPLFMKKELCQILGMKGTTFSYWKKKSSVEDTDTSKDFRLMDICRTLFGGRATYTLYSPESTMTILNEMEASRQKNSFTNLSQLKYVVLKYMRRSSLHSSGSSINCHHHHHTHPSSQPSPHQQTLQGASNPTTPSASY